MPVMPMGVVSVGESVIKPREVRRALPHPPAPSSDMISYGPSRVPGLNPHCRECPES